MPELAVPEPARADAVPTLAGQPRSGLSDGNALGNGRSGNGGGPGNGNGNHGNDSDHRTPASPADTGVGTRPGGSAQT